jgi:uncharacterized lipoprotein YddW (UPF0748 family)
LQLFQPPTRRYQCLNNNIKVIPWLEYGFAASPDLDGGHILTNKPAEWSALDSEGNKVRHGGLTWMNSLNTDVQKFIEDLILEIVESYPGIAGIQGDDRFPAMPFLGGYDTKTKANYKKNLPKYFENRKDDEWKNWVEFRAKELTNYLQGLSKKVKEKNPHLIVSMAPSLYPYGLNTLMQDSDVWVKNKSVDFLHPQIYRYSVDKYKAEVDKIIEKVKKEDHGKYAPGIAFRVRNEHGIYINLTPKEIVECVRYNGQKGLGGQVFFYYDDLRKNDGAMAKALSDFWKKKSKS